MKSSGDLVPIAIQLFQQPSDTNPIWTPDDSKYDWLLAKMWFRNADHQVHQVRERMENDVYLIKGKKGTVRIRAKGPITLEPISVSIE